MNASHESALLLLEKAMGDSAIVTRLANDESIPSWSIGFHAQQAVEKAIKAVLTNRAIIYPRTHNLAMLLELLKQNEIALPPNSDDLSSLTPYGSVFRYEDETEGMKTTIERGSLAKWAASTLIWANKLVAAPNS